MIAPVCLKLRGPSRTGFRYVGSMVDMWGLWGASQLVCIELLRPERGQ